eukprot:TRINITY_DN2006_c0_g5_i1.p1 TRINITY_DN2006_c0_g5~~TRINITY_DN2006_c0_g5_i1.p1  ORF type:complete len:305 (-),score=47.64 TRINITY_DN2006_c0_g5_i1:133-1047(-)
MDSSLDELESFLVVKDLEDSPASRLGAGERHFTEPNEEVDIRLDQDFLKPLSKRLYGRTSHSVQKNIVIRRESLRRMEDTIKRNQRVTTDESPLISSLFIKGRTKLQMYNQTSRSKESKTSKFTSVPFGLVSGNKKKPKPTRNLSKQRPKELDLFEGHMSQTRDYYFGTPVTQPSKSTTIRHNFQGLSKPGRLVELTPSFVRIYGGTSELRSGAETTRPESRLSKVRQSMAKMGNEDISLAKPLVPLVKQLKKFSGSDKNLNKGRVSPMDAPTLSGIQTSRAFKGRFLFLPCDSFVEEHQHFGK